MIGNGGFWNRAGRRSGGNRPVVIVASAVCPHCGAGAETTPYPFYWRVHPATRIETEWCRKCGKTTGRSRGGEGDE